MTFNPRKFSNQRDQTYPSEIAAQRPMLAPRITCPAMNTKMDEKETAAMEQWEARQDAREPAIRGSVVEDRVALFNEQLRSGLGGGQKPER
jgi:hypothetical protein